MEHLENYINSNKERFIAELKNLLRIPSISASKNHNQDLERTATLVAQNLIDIGCNKVQILPTKGNNVVYGEKIIAVDAPTVLVYGHYDVQPVDPINLWDSPPFEPIIKKTPLHPEGAIYARGACDDKGQFFMHVKAIEYLIQTQQLPCNVKFIIEGEEEIGSPSLEDFIRANQQLLANDVVLISDTGMIANNVPSITTGLRGLSYVEVSITGPNRDLHSGFYGGAVANPINILCDMISKLHDSDRKITIPGFYDDIIEVSATERTAMAKAPFDLNEYQKSLDINAVYGEKGYSTYERSSIRPTLDVNGIWGGYIDEGAKTVLPSTAHAKISMRLVAGQDPDKITQLFTNYFTQLAPDSVKVTIKPHHGGKAYKTPLNGIDYLAAHKAYTKTFGKEPIPQPSGGSIPIVAMFEEIFKSNTILMGFGLDSDAIHSPNEHFGLFNFFKGIETIPYFYKYYTELFKKDA